MGFDDIRDRLVALVSSLAGRRLVVAGDYVLDRFVYGHPKRISREAPVLILRFWKEESLPGGAGNTAANIAAEEAGRSERKSYLPEVGITCLLDMGNGAVYVHRDSRRERMVPLRLVGHWLKQAWGSYYKLSKRKMVPRLPGM